jgi:hypothetical protein
MGIYDHDYDDGQWAARQFNSTHRNGLVPDHNPTGVGVEGVGVWLTCDQITYTW